MRRFLSLLPLIAFLALTFPAHAQDKALERINESGEINCGVYVLGTIFSYDKAGEPQGFTTDLFKEIAARTGLKVRYTEISSFGTLAQDLDAGKFDMVCAPVLILPATLMKFQPGTFIAEDEIGIYADGAADLSGIKSFADLNDPQYTFTGMDGELGGLYVPKLFPKAHLSLLALGSAPTMMFMDVHTKKANFMVLSRVAAIAYLQENPGKLKRVTNESILKTSVRLLYPRASAALKANMDTVVDDMTRDGTIQNLLKKHGLLEK